MLHEIAGKPLVQHVWERCLECPKLDGVVVATDDVRIADVAAGFGAEVEMTSADHASGTDRVAEVMGRRAGATHAINVQGDEPMISPDLIGELAEALTAEDGPGMVSAATPITDEGLIRDPNVVKVALGANGDAVYFSRCPIPYARNAGEARYFRHHGIYGFSREFLFRFVGWGPSPLELAEGLEQLRALDHGARIRMLVTGEVAIGVDTPSQAETVSQLLAKR